MRQAAARKNHQLLVHVIEHSPNGGASIIEQEIGGAGIAVIREADAAGIATTLPETLRMTG
jgi:hypothetical protein